MELPNELTESERLCLWRLLHGPSMLNSAQICALDRRDWITYTPFIHGPGKNLVEKQSIKLTALGEAVAKKFKIMV